MAFAFEEEALPKKLNLYVWRRIFSYALRHYKLLLLILLFVLVVTFYDSAFIPLMNKAAIDSVENILVNNVNDLVIKIDIYGLTFNTSFWGYIFMLIGGIIVRSFAIMGNFFLMNYVAMCIVMDLRMDGYKRIQELSFSYFDRTASGWLIARLQNDASSVGDLLSSGLINIIWIIFEIIFTLITMFTVSWQMSLVILITVPFLMIISPIFEITILKKHRVARSAYSNYVRWLAECISGALTIKSLAIEDKVYGEANDVTEDIRKKMFGARKVNAFFQPSISLLSAIATALVIVFGIYVFNAQDATSIVSISTLVLALGFVSKIYSPLQSFFEIFAEFMAQQASAEKLLALIDTKPTIVDKKEVVNKYGDIFNPKKENYELMEGDIDFDHVFFSYLKDQEVIHDLNVHIEKGTSLAIVGETGSGKSTFVNLLARFYEPTKGSIKIDGVDYKEKSVGWLRSNIGFVQQNPFIFRGTFLDNIRYGKLDATLEEVRRAAMLVDIDSFIMSFKDGYNHLLTDGGNELSTGQKQLISFARAIIRNPRIMILDEATSSVDTETELTIQSAINIILQGRTSIIIAHRLSTIVNAKRILVMKDGRVVEDGNHKSLMQKRGYYHRLYMNQFKELTLDEQISTYEAELQGQKLDE